MLDKVALGLWLAASASTGADVITTRQAMNRCPACYESNPITRKIGIVQWPVMTTAATVGTSRWLRKEGFKKWWVPVAISIAVHSGAAIRNSRH